MLKIGNLEIDGRGKRPTSREDFKVCVRAWTSVLGLRLQFENRREGHAHQSTSYCGYQVGKATICESYAGHVYPLWDLMETTLHEVAHWIQYNEGLFKNYFGIPFYGRVKLGSRDLTLALRAERHADCLSGKLLKELYGMDYRGNSVYSDTEEAKKFLKKHYRKR